MEGAVTYMPVEHPEHPERPDRPHPAARHASSARRDGRYPSQLSPQIPPPSRASTGPPADYPPRFRQDHPQRPEPPAHRAPPDPADLYRPAPPYPPVSPRRVSPFESALPDLRNKVVNRLHVMNGLHARQAWERRRRDPLGPHVLVFFYAEPPTGGPPRCELRTAARLFLAADEPRLPMLLYELLDVARELLEAGGDPRTEMSNWHDEMSTRATYLGVGISSLDTPAATWRQVQHAAGSELDIPGRCYARLIDGTLLLVDRLAKQDFGKVNIWTTHLINDVSGEPQRRWNYGHHLADPDLRDPATRNTWHWLDQLHNIILRGSRVR